MSQSESDDPVCQYKCISKTSSEKFDCRTYYKYIENCDFCSQNTFFFLKHQSEVLLMSNLSQYLVFRKRKVAHEFFVQFSIIL